MKIFLKIISTLLAVMIVFVPLSALAGEVHNTYICPRIYIHGLMAVPIQRDKNDKNSEVIFPPSTEKILSAVTGALPKLGLSLASGGLKGFGDEACRVANELMSEAYLDQNGNVKDNSGVYFEYPEASSIKKDSKLSFDYDWRVDPVETAAQLNDFVDYVLRCSGAQKVNLSAHSLGGVILITYISIYGYEKVHGACFNSSAVFGESYTGDLMKGEMSFSGDAFDYFLHYLIDETEYQYLLSAVTDAASKLGVFSAAAFASNELLDAVKESLFNQVMLPLFCHWLTIWAMVPDEDIEEGVENVFGSIAKDQDYSELIGKIERYNTLVRSGKKETLAKLNENANVYVIARYGYPSIPITPSYSKLTDGTIDVKYASFGAVTSLYKESLSEEYLADADPEYISPDKSVDASKCMFPEQTWFIRSFKHYSMPDSVVSFTDLLLEQAEQASVDTFEKYPRFLFYDYENDTILPDTNYQSPTLVSSIKNILNDVIKLIRFLIRKISG